MLNCLSCLNITIVGHMSCAHVQKNHAAVMLLIAGHGLGSCFVRCGHRRKRDGWHVIISLLHEHHLTGNHVVYGFVDVACGESPPLPYRLLLRGALVR